MPSLITILRDLQLDADARALELLCEKTDLQMADVILDPDTLNQYFRSGHITTLLDSPAVNFSKLADSDSFSFDDVPALGLGLGKTDSLSMSDTPLVSAQFNRSFTDAFALDDFTSVDAVVKDMANAKTNVFGFADDQAFGIGKGLSDSFNFADAVDSFVIGKGLTDSQPMTESLSRTVQFVRSFADTFVMDDAATIDALQKDTNALKQNIFAMGDLFARTVSYNRQFADSFAPVESHAVTFSKSAADDTFTLSESLASTVVYNRAFSDSQGFGDAVDSQDVSKGLSDTQALTEAHVSSVSLGKTDAVTLSESPASDVGKGLTDSVSMSESLARTVAYARSFADAFSMDDAATIDALVKDSSTAKTNVFGFSDAQEFGFGKTATDTFSFADDEEFEVGKGLSDSVTVTENFSFALFSNAAMNAAPLNVSPFNE